MRRDKKGVSMTYCVGVQVDEGLVFLSDSRTNAGVDHISTFRKMTFFEMPGDRVLVLLSAGNLAISQSVTGLLRERVKNAKASVLTARSMSDAARLVGDAVRDVHHARRRRRSRNTASSSIPTFIIGGQIGGEPLRLFHVYSAGNFIETTADTRYFQIGESKYGKPIIDRVVKADTSLAAVAKCALISMDSTIRSNLSVGHAARPGHRAPRRAADFAASKHRPRRRLFQSHPGRLGRVLT